MKLAKNMMTNWQPTATQMSIFPPTGSQRLMRGLSLTATVRNVTDEEIRHHTSPMKDKLPEAGQDIRLTARYRF